MQHYVLGLQELLVELQQTCAITKYKDVNYRSTKQNLRFRQVQNLKVFSVLELQRTFVQFHPAH